MLPRESLYDFALSLTVTFGYSSVSAPFSPVESGFFASSGVETLLAGFLLWSGFAAYDTGIVPIIISSDKTIAQSFFATDRLACISLHSFDLINSLYICNLFR